MTVVCFVITAKMLIKLDYTKTATLLQWKPVISLSQSIRKTISWYWDYYFSDDFDGYATTVKQIQTYVRKAHGSNLPWAVKD